MLIGLFGRSIPFLNFNQSNITGGDARRVVGICVFFVWQHVWSTPLLSFFASGRRYSILTKKRPSAEYLDSFRSRAPKVPFRSTLVSPPHLFVIIGILEIGGKGCLFCKHICRYSFFALKFRCPRFDVPGHQRPECPMIEPTPQPHRNHRPFFLHL